MSDLAILKKLTVNYFKYIPLIKQIIIQFIFNHKAEFLYFIFTFRWSVIPGLLCMSWRIIVLGPSVFWLLNYCIWNVPNQPVCVCEFFFLTSNVPPSKTSRFYFKVKWTPYHPLSSSSFSILEPQFWSWNIFFLWPQLLSLLFSLNFFIHSEPELFCIGSPNLIG